MVEGPSGEQLTGLQLVKKFPAFHENPKVHYRTHKRPPTISILGQPNSVHIPTFRLLEIRPNIIHPSTPRSHQCSLSHRFPHQDPIHPLSSPLRATWNRIFRTQGTIDTAVTNYVRYKSFTRIK